MRTITRRLTALAGTAALASALGAGVASAQTDAGPGGNVNAAISVGSTLIFTFTSAQSFSVAPGATAAAAVAFTVQSNNATGYQVTESAPDLTGPASATLPAGDLSETLHFGPTLAGTVPAAALTNAPSMFITGSTPSASPADNYAQDWSAATLPGNTPAGSYGTVISYVLSANA